MSKRKTFTKQISEFYDKIDKNSILIDGIKLDRYFFDKTNEKIYLKQKNHEKFKLIKPSFNGRIEIITFTDANKKILTRSYNKVLEYLRDNY